MRLLDLFRNSRGGIANPEDRLSRGVQREWLRPLQGAARALYLALADGADVADAITVAERAVVTARSVVTRAHAADAARANGHAAGADAQ